MAFSYLDELLETAANIVQLEQEESERKKRGDWRAGKAEWEGQQAHFNKIRLEYVDQLLAHESAREGVVAKIQGLLDRLREQADPSRYPAIDYTIDNLVPYLEKETDRSPLIRKVRKKARFAGAAVAAIAYFGIALSSGTPITDDIQRRQGLEQRAAAVEKVIRYDKWTDSPTLLGRWFDRLVYWPIKPTEAESKGAEELVELVLEAQKYVEGCRSIVGDGSSWAADRVKTVSEVADYVQTADAKWEDTAVATVAKGLERSTACIEARLAQV